MQCKFCQADVVEEMADGLCESCRSKLQVAADQSSNILAAAGVAVKEKPAAEAPGPGRLVWESEGSAESPLEYPISTLLTPTGTLLVVDEPDNYRVHQFAQDGKYLGLLMEIELGEGPGEIEDPQGVCCDPDGRILFADAANDRISVWSADGKFECTIGGSGTGDGEFARPCDVTTDSDGFIYVADSINRRIQKLSPDGIFCFETRLLQNELEMSEPTAVIIDDEFAIYVGDGRRNVVAKLSSDGKPLSVLPGPGDPEDLFDRPVDLRQDKAGRLYVSDQNNSRVRRFEPDGTLSAQMVATDDGASGFDGGDIAVIGDSVVIPDASSSRIICLNFPE